MPSRQRSIEFDFAPSAVTSLDRRPPYIRPSAVKMWQSASMCVFTNP